MLNTIQRANNYRFQELHRTGRILDLVSGRFGPLPVARTAMTPKQRRRIEHKANKAAAKVARYTGPRKGRFEVTPVATELSLEATAFMAARDSSPDTGRVETINECPRCKATGDNSCVTPSGKATKTHKGRGE